MLWIILFLMAALALFLLVEPFFRAQPNAEHLEEEDYLAAQIADIERDRAAGLISKEEADAASIEARRRLLAAHRAAGRQTPAVATPLARQLSVMLVAAAPAVAFALYVGLGNPGGEETDEGLRLAMRNQVTQGAGSAAAPPLAESIAALEERLAANPDHVDDWVVLAESYANMNRYTDAAEAFGKAKNLAPDQPYLYAAEGESVAMAAGGVVTAEARALFAEALQRDAQEPRARFYLAIAAYQDGLREEALDALLALERDAPPNAGWLPTVRSQIEMIAQELGRPVANAVQQADTESLEAEIATGDASYEVWLALINAYAAAGDMDKAALTISRAKERYAGAPFVLQEIEKLEASLSESPPARRGPTTEQMQAAAQMSAEDREAMIEGMVSGLAARLEREPDDLEGWTMLARSYGVLGEHEKSAAAFARAAALAPENLDLHLGRAEALLNGLNAEGKPIDDKAKAAIGEVAQRAPDHPFALYFQGLAASQRGDADEARIFWTQLKNTMPADTPQAAQVQDLIDSL